MPLDAAALARALELSGTPAVQDDAVPEGARRVRRTMRRATSSSPARRKRGSSATSRRRAARRRRSASSTSARPAAGRPRRARRRRRSRRCSRSRDCPSPSPVPRVDVPLRGPAADRRPGRGRAALGAACSRRSSPSPCSSPAARPAPSCRPSAQFPGLLGPAHAALGLARRVRRRVGAGKSDRSRSLHALQRVHPRLPGAARSTGATRSTSTAARRTASAWPPAARRRRSTSRGATSRAPSASISCSTCSATPQLADAPAAAGLFRARRAMPVAQAQAVTELAAMIGEFEKPKYFAYKASICAHSRSRKPGCNQCIDVCSTAAIAPTATTSRSSRTCAWAAAPARPSARRAR